MNEQDNLSISDYYDKVDKQLTLIINKQIMSNNGNRETIDALNERARENALRVFISGLRRPMCDILFSARPNDLPSALAEAQELETSRMRHNFARAFAVGNSTIPLLNPILRQNQHSTHNFQNINSRPTPMEIDHNTYNYHRRPYPKMQYNLHGHLNKLDFNHIH